MSEATNTVCALKAQGIHKRFGNIIANQDVSISLQYGRVHALLGENGAGKSTLASILYGLFTPDQGQIEIDGQAVCIRRPSDAISNGLGLVQQHFSLIPAFTVLDNILLGNEGLLIDASKAESDIKKQLESFGIDLPLHQSVDQLPVGVQQQVEIAKILFRRARIMLFDEPTAALVSSEIDRFHETLNRLRDKNIAILLITHRLPEVVKAADDITVLRKGKVVLQDQLENTNADALAEAIVGERFPDKEYDLPRPGECVLQLKNISFSKSKPSNASPHTFEVHQGEMLGIAGISGNGQEELIDGLLGVTKVYSGEFLLSGENISNLNVAGRRAKGMAYIPQDRIGRALLKDHSIFDNYLLNRNALPRNERLIPQREAIAQRIGSCIEEYKIQTSSLQQLAGQLSGGHQQRLVVSREFLSKPKLIIAHDPTRGLDLRASRFVYELLVEQCRNGAAVILLSSEWSDLFLLCKRIAVLYRGELVEIRDADQWTVRELGRRMSGIIEPDNDNE